MTVKFWRDDRDDKVFFVELANPPVNAINLAVRRGLHDAMLAIQATTGLERVLLMGSETIFAAGGDAREFDASPIAPHLPDVLAMIEASDIPWIAVINGAALGGGLELALACRYRIASPKAQLGLPEVLLGIVPGAGGTQRLPRLIGFAAALEMITSGKPISAKAGLAAGLLNLVDANPMQVALAVASTHLAAATPVGQLPNPRIDEAALAKSNAGLARRAKGQIAPVKATELVTLTSHTNFTDGIAAERDCFLTLRQSEQAKALRHVFFAERGAKAPAALTNHMPKIIDQAVVVGGGTMGAGIAHALVRAGITTVTIETNDATAKQAAARAESLIEAGVKRGLITAQKADEMRSRYSISTDYTSAANAQIAIEAVVEDIAVKITVFQKLQEVMPANAILASNTSYLDINAIAASLDDPSRLVGLHFFVPAHIMKLLEIIRGDASAPTALASGFRLAKQLGKIPVVAGLCDGFIGNRILARYREAADLLLLHGATSAQIDEAMTGFGYAMGPYEAQDMSGLDIAFANRRRQDASRDPNRTYVHIADKMVEAGRLGRKTGLGWYSYANDGKAATDPLVDALIVAEADHAGITRRHFSNDEIVKRLLLAMINEGANILQEAVAQNASDIDLVSILGYGFPRWRGGLMHYADQLGMVAILAGLKDFSAEDQHIWQPSQLILDAVKTGSDFASFKN
ncbi:3-hydroxyacyl-CoA dehydrogenase NAD-binding domain-containing protein [Candidatus Ponderosibacter sp. Uisw_141_02]|jgi:3-hydroxyacyl-CoA dehydrogenase|uniref:3-hydroxyacyl-CoA dehydrogenase NAD-binding domain-containing protein n=1 Tax=Candidatus Ponderosibacter sp. Uisw_141_02 TaxID=3231000 RepID=UPI003D505C99